MKQLVALEAILERVDGDDFSSLSGRIAFQKRIYLVQIAGIHLGYRFSWNQHGPYSSELAQDRLQLEARRDDIQESLKKLNLRKEVESVLAQVRPLIQRPNTSHLTDVQWLELLSSLHYLSLEENGIPSRSEEEVQALEKDLISRKPHLEGGQKFFGEAWERLRSLSRLSNSA